MSTATTPSVASAPVAKLVVASAPAAPAASPSAPLVSKEQLLAMFANGDIDLADLVTALAEVGQRLGKPDILKLLTSGKINIDDASALLSDNEEKRTLKMKVGEKGGITFKGLRGTHHSFGLTLYVEAVEDLFAARAMVEQFIKDNNSKLARKQR